MGNKITLEDIYKLVNSVNGNLSSKIDNIKANLQELNNKVNSQIAAAEHKIEALQAENYELKRKLIGVVKIVKKKNLIIFGIEETPEENPVESIIQLET